MRAHRGQHAANPFQAGKFAPGQPGVTGGAVVGETIVIKHGSGSYSFVRAG